MSAPLAGHLGHLLGSGGFVAVALGSVAFADLRQRAERPRRQWPSPLLAVTAAGIVGAAGVHLAVTPEHFGEAFVYGLFFAVTAALQLALAAALVARPGRGLLRVAVAANLAVVLLWLMTRTIAIPLGPDAGSTEEIGVLDLLATGFELVSLTAGAVLLRRRQA